MIVKIWLAACCVLWATEGLRGPFVQTFNAIAWWVFFGAWFGMLLA